MDKKITHLEEVLVGAEHGQHVRISADGVRLNKDRLTAQAWLTTRNDTPHFSLFDHNDAKRVELFLERDGRPHLFLQDANGVPRLVGWLTNEGVPFVELHDAQRKVRLSLTLDQDDSEPQLVVHDQTGEDCVSLSVDEDGKPMLHVRSEAGIWESWPVGPADGAGKKVA